MEQFTELQMGFRQLQSESVADGIDRIILDAEYAGA